MKRWLPLALAAMAMPMLACASLPPGSEYNVHVSTEFKVETQSVVFDALREWSDATGVTFKTVLSADDCSETTHCIKIVPGNASDSRVGETTRYVAYDSAAVVIDLAQIAKSESQGNLLYVTIAHELGHAMGLEHDKGGTLMFPGNSESAEHVTCKDVQQYFYLRGKGYDCP